MCAHDNLQLHTIAMHSHVLSLVSTGPKGYMLPRAVCTWVTVGEVGRLLYKWKQEDGTTESCQSVTVRVLPVKGLTAGKSLYTGFFFVAREGGGRGRLRTICNTGEGETDVRASMPQGCYGFHSPHTCSNKSSWSSRSTTGTLWTSPLSCRLPMISTNRESAQRHTNLTTKGHTYAHRHMQQQALLLSVTTER